MRTVLSFVLPTALLCLLFLSLVTGCSSGSSSPTSPELDQTPLTTPDSPEHDGASAAVLPLGIYEVSWSPETNEIAVNSLRSAENSLDVTGFLQDSENRLANIDIEITDAGMFISDGLVKLDVSITHPFEMSAMKVFDVMGVALGDGSKVSGYDPLVRYAGVNNFLLVNSDGYTSIADSSDLTATINGYKYFAEGINASQKLEDYFIDPSAIENQGAFLPGSTITRNYTLRFPITDGCPDVHFQFAVIGHLENAQEPFCIGCDTSDSSVYYVNDFERGGELVLDMTIMDWQAPLTSGDVTQQISKIVIESPSGMIPGGAIVFSGDKITNAVRHCCTDEFSTRLVFSIDNIVPTGPFEQLLIAVESNPIEDGSQPTSYFRTLVPVHNEYIAPVKEYVNLIVMLSDTPDNLYTNVREQGWAAYSQIDELSEQIKDIYRSNRGFETSTSVKSQVTPIVNQILDLREARAAYINSLLHNALDEMQDGLAIKLEAIPDTQVKLKDLILNSLVVETTRDHVEEIENLTGVLEVIEDTATASLNMDNSAQALKLKPGTYPNVLWNEGYHGEGIDVLGFDSGVYMGHSAFNGVNFESEVFPLGTSDCTPDDDWAGAPNGHGTMTAGVITGRHSTLKGMSYQIETYYNGKHCDVGAYFSTTVMIAYDWAALGGDGFNDAEVINLSMSWGFNCDQYDGLDYRPSFVDTTVDMYDVIWSVAASNQGSSCSGSFIRDKPQTNYNGVTVGGVRSNETGTRTDDSYYTGGKHGPVYGPYMTEERMKPDLVTYARIGAPGNDDNFYWFTGTSVAAPHYAGFVATLMSAGITDSKEIRALTFATAEDWGTGTGPQSDGPDYYTGFGIPDAWEAYSHIADTFSGTLDFNGDADIYQIENVQAGDRVVLVYNRHGDENTWKISNLDLIAYDINTGEQLYETTKVYDNKEYIQFDEDDAGKDIMIVATLTNLADGLSYEQYAISASTEMTQPAFLISINTPPQIHQYSVIEINASAENVTGIQIENVTVDLNLPPGWELVKGDDPQNIGTLEPGQIGAATFHVLVTTYGEETLSVDVSGDTCEDASGTTLNIAQITPLVCPDEVDENEIFDGNVEFVNHSTQTYTDLSLTIIYETDKVSLVAGDNPASKGDKSSGESAYQEWDLQAVGVGDTALSLNVEFTYDGENVSFTTSDVIVTITVLPYEPTLLTPSDNTQYQLGDSLHLSWEKEASGPDPDCYWLDVWVDGEHWPVFPDGGFSMGDKTSLYLPPTFVEFLAQDGVWEWAVASEISGKKYWSDKWIIDKHVAPDLIGPDDGTVVEVDELFNWNNVPGAINYIVRLTGILPDDQPFYMPLNSDAFYFQLTQPYYDVLNPDVNYSWAIAGTTLGWTLTAQDQEKLAKLSYSEIRSFSVE